MELEARTQSCSSQAILTAVERHHRQRNLLHDHGILSLAAEDVFAPAGCEARLTVREISLRRQADDVDVLIELDWPIEDQKSLEEINFQLKFLQNPNTHNVVVKSFLVELWMNDDRLNVSLLIRQPLLRRLSVPLASASLQVSFANIEHAMCSLK